MNASGDSIRVVHPLFREEGDGSIPISPLQLQISKMPLDVAVNLNGEWHSRLPSISNPQNCTAYGATFGGKYYAVALWGPPVARGFNGQGYWELRRMAIASDAPKNTGTRMLRIMRLLIERERPDICKLISYQDTDVHVGTIYKGRDGYRAGSKRTSGPGGTPESGTQCRRPPTRSGGSTRSARLRPLRQVEKAPDVLR